MVLKATLHLIEFSRKLTEEEATPAKYTEAAFQPVSIKRAWSLVINTHMRRMCKSLQDTTENLITH